MEMVEAVEAAVTTVVAPLINRKVSQLPQIRRMKSLGITPI